MTFEIMQWATRDRETGTIIDLFTTEEEADDAIKKYEEEDRAEGIYTEHFYETAQLNHEE